MKRHLRIACSLMFSLILIVLGCGEEMTGPEEDQTAHLVKSLPPNCSNISSGFVPVELFFDSPPSSVKVNGTSATLIGKGATWRTKEPFKSPTVVLKVQWVNRDGSEGTSEIILHVIAPPDPPVLTNWSLRDHAIGGNTAVNVDPKRINREGITFRFSEPIKQAWAWIFQESPDALYCDVTLSNETVKFTGFELVSGRRYTIHGVVTDFGDNYTTIKETFTTKE